MAITARGRSVRQIARASDGEALEPQQVHPEAREDAMRHANSQFLRNKGQVGESANTEIDLADAWHDDGIATSLAAGPAVVDTTDGGDVWFHNGDQTTATDAWSDAARRASQAADRADENRVSAVAAESSTAASADAGGATASDPAPAAAKDADIGAPTNSGNPDGSNQNPVPADNTAIVGAADTGTVGSSSGWVPRAFALQSAHDNGQWYLDNTAGGLDLNVADVWLDYSGEGVTVAVYDNGVQATHPDLDDNYGTDMPGNDGAPESRDNHGTAVAGIIAAENYNVGTVGVAFDATIVGVDLWNEEILATATSPGMAKQDWGNTVGFRQNFDVVNQSFNWGYFTGWANATNAPTTAYQNISDAVTQGRDNLGTIVVTAAGNHRNLNWDTNTSNLLNNRSSIVVAAVEDDGNVRWNSNPGANLLVSAFGNNIQTTDRTGADGYNLTGDVTNFVDTSAAAPQISGVVALMLEANPNLGWRDVQTILSYSARHVGDDMDVQPVYNTDASAGALEFAKYAWNYNHADNWNGGGLHFSNDYGFGLVDARAAVRLAEGWTDQSTSANEQLAGDSRAAASDTGADAIPETGTLRYEFDIHGSRSRSLSV